MKTALVTGASRGMGEEFARQLAQHGWRVVFVARSEQRLSQVVCSLPERVGLPHLVLPADLTLASERSLLQE
jgi:short-subunit dehydrogenase